jgi:hypothetical protein
MFYLLFCWMSLCWVSFCWMSWHPLNTLAYNSKEEITAEKSLLYWVSVSFMTTAELKMESLVQCYLTFFWLKLVLDSGPEQRESKMTVLCPLIIIILISLIIIYYIIIKLLIMENHPSWNGKWNSWSNVIKHFSSSPTAGHNKLAHLPVPCFSSG